MFIQCTHVFTYLLVYIKKKEKDGQRGWEGEEKKKLKGREDTKRRKRKRVREREGRQK